jgi:hypothetical protein
MRGYDAGSWLGVAGACCESHLAGFLMSLSFFPPSALLLHLSFSSHLCDELCSAFVTNRDAIESCAPRSIHEQSAQVISLGPIPESERATRQKRGNHTGRGNDNEWNNTYAFFEQL